MSPIFTPADYFIPSSLEEAIDYLSRYGEKTKILAGGTMIYELAGKGLLSGTERLLDISQLGLSYVIEEEDRFRVGVATTFTEILESPIAKVKGFEALVQSLESIGPIQIKNAGTIGGEVCSGYPFLDLPPALLALDTTVKIHGPPGSRLVELDKFFLGFVEIDMESDELAVEFLIPKPKSGTKSSFQKISRNAEDLAIVNLVAALSLDRHEECENVRIALGCVSETPVRIKNTEKVFEGYGINEELIRRAETQLAQEIRPDSSPDISSEYRLHISKVLLRRAINDILQSVGS